MHLPCPDLATRPARFVLIRTCDMSAVSGIGTVAEGIVFSNGKAVLSWLRPPYSLGVYDSLDALLEVQGHEGATSVQWVD